jgi:hypothetical protein
MPLTTKKRSRVIYHGDGISIGKASNGSTIFGYPQRASFKQSGTQITESEGHPFRHAWRGRDDGGEFFTRAQTINGMNPAKDTSAHIYGLTAPPTGSGSVYSYSGPVFPVNPATINQLLSQVPFTGSSRASLNALGTTAIARCKPGEPVANLSIALAELLREGAPNLIGHTLWERRAKDLGPAPKKGSSEYLNWTFGWQPLIADVKSVADALVNQDRYMRQYERDDGRIVRRGYDFPVERSETIFDLGSIRPPYGTHAGCLTNLMFKDGIVSQGTLYRTETSVKHRWFRGAFTYHLPAGYYSRDRMIRAATRAKVLLGIELTPEVIWNLTPWSWAADWFANTGDLLSNVSDFASDGLVMHYGYMMETSKLTHTYSLFNHGLRGVESPLTLDLETTQKQRVKASPFGFGLTWDDFSPRQLAILAALGINRVL